ncbi:MAG TPA: A24 family peptidase [Rhizomicrobium sp.]|nr:A24 family peptidase [Rhizomicrobium sp.]
MIGHWTILAGALAASAPAGYAAALAARWLADDARIPVAAMIALLAGAFVWSWFVMPDLALVALSCALAWALIVLGAVDALAFRLPDILTLPLIAAGLATAQWLPQHDLLGHSLAALIAIGAFFAIAAFYQRARGREGLGMGDVKLAGAAGAWLGWQALPYVVLLACAAGLVWIGVGAMRRGREALGERIPFGVALCLAIWIVWLYGPPDAFGPLFYSR